MMKAHREADQASINELTATVESLRSLLKRDSLWSEVERLQSEIQSLTAEKDTEQSRYTNELTELLEANKKITVDLENEKLNGNERVSEIESAMNRQLGSLRNECAEKSKQIEQLQVQIQKLKELENEKKKEYDASKYEMEKRIRAAESKQVQVEDELAVAKKLLAKSEEESSNLREEIENLLHQQTLAIEKITAATTAKSNAERQYEEANEKSKTLAHRLSLAEKHAKNTDEKLEELRKELDDKVAIVKKFTVDVANLKRSNDDKVRNVAIIAALVAFVISRLVAVAM
jgi:chromosome segregation ATPase